ncbi:MAG: transglutaminase-like domain-containing protein [Proteobacteria bacterium]|nr:transglutaminase-like domain-containing protein [Pseudomonadota bacterium]
MKKIAVIFILSITFLFLILNFSKSSKKKFYFENIEIIEPNKYVELITPENREVERISQRVKDPVKAYYYVRDFIIFNPMMVTNKPEVTISLREGNCLSKAVLLVSLYRALGIPESQVRIIVGELHSDKRPVQHAWVEVKFNGVWFQQDTTDLIGSFEFDQFKDKEYLKKFVRVENYCFNDTGFAVVSQRNRFK